MDHRTKSSTILTIMILLGSLLLTSCADTRWPTWLTGEPDESVLNAPRVVGKPSGALDKTYPNLASVPEKPKDFSTTSERKELISTLKQDKTEAQDVRERLEALPSVDSGLGKGAP